MKADGALVHRTKGTPQGGPISPLIANVFLHYGFDLWMTRTFPGALFERFADDVVVHCVTERQARQVREAIGHRLADVGLELHPDKTRIVYCKDSNRRLDYDRVSFTFCGYTFRPRKAYNKTEGKAYTSFLPAVGPGKLTEMRRKVSVLADRPAHDFDPQGPRRPGQSGDAGLALVFHRVLPDRGDPGVQAHRRAGSCAGPGRSTNGWNAAADGRTNGSKGCGS